MWRHIASNAVTFLILGLFLLGGIILWGRGQYDAPRTSGRRRFACRWSVVEHAGCGR